MKTIKRFIFILISCWVITACNLIKLIISPYLFIREIFSEISLHKRYDKRDLTSKDVVKIVERYIR